MKTLIVEDDFTSRLLLQEILCVYGDVDIAINGQDAIEAARLALEAKQPYDLICMDIMMPGIGGQEALKEIRKLEDLNQLPPPNGAKILMTSALDDIQNKLKAFTGLCDDYLVKPIDKERLIYVITNMNLIP